MGRGYCYEITTGRNDAGYMYEDRLYGFVPIEFEYVEDVSEDERAELVEEFISRFTNNFTKEINAIGKTVYAFHISKEDKLEFFRDRFYAVKNMVSNKLTLEDFATHCCNLAHFIDDTNSDTVWLDDSLYTLDSFIRNAVEGQTYYVGNVCYTK